MKTHRFNPSAVGAFMAIVFLLICNPAGAVNWRITQITDNTGLDSSPKVISQGWVTWVFRLPPNKEEIMLYYPGSTPIRQITDNDYRDINPDLSWDSVNGKITLCWQAVCGPDDTSEIFTLGTKAPLRLTDNTFDDIEPKNWSTHIVWEGKHNNADWEVFHYTPSLGVVQLTIDTLDDYDPVVSGSRILWAKDDPEGDYGQETYYFDGTDIVRLTENAWMEDWHKINGNHLVWGMFHGSGAAGNWEIHHKHGSGSIEQLTDNGLANKYPVVSGDRIAWVMYDGNDDEIMYFDGANFRRLTNNTFDDSGARISGDRIVWHSDGPTASITDNALMLFDDSTGTTTTLDYGRIVLSLDIAGDFIVWETSIGLGTEIMMAIACDKLAGDVNDDCVVDLADFAALAADWLNCTLPAVYCP